MKIRSPNLKPETTVWKHLFSLFTRYGASGLRWSTSGTAGGILCPRLQGSQGMKAPPRKCLAAGHSGRLNLPGGCDGKPWAISHNSQGWGFARLSLVSLSEGKATMLKLLWETWGWEQKWEKPLRVIKDQRTEPCAKYEWQVLYEHVHTSLRLEKASGKTA